MVNAQLLDYVKQQLAQNVSKEAIYANLVASGGWNPTDINEAFSVLGINMSNTSSTTGAIPMVPVKYAGFWIRWVALAVDGLVLIIPVGILQFVVGLVLVGVGLPSIGVRIISYLVYTLASWLYFSLMTHKKGATLGKMLVGITVKSDDLQKLSFGRILLRETIGKFVSGIILGIGYIIAGVTQKKQALHDKFAHSVVVYKDPSKSHRTGLIIGIIIAAILPALAILGILSSVVLVSLNTARHKGQDAKTKADLSQMRVAAEVYYGNNNNSYSQAINCNSGMFLEQNMQQSISDIASKDVTCYAETTTYAISAKLNDPTQSYCFDSSGYGGSGIAVDNGSVASCQASGSSMGAQNTSDQTQATGDTVSTASYSYTLPAGWQSAPNTGQGVQATNKTSGYVLSLAEVTIPASAGKVTSITDVMSPDNMSPIIKSEFPTATISGSSLGTLGGEKAITTTFSATVTAATSDGQKQSKPLSMLQYNTVHRGVLYTLVFISASSQQQTATTDFQMIINSFIFKQ